MSEPLRCASCGLLLDPPGPGGLCPVCLLKMGLQAAEGPDTASAPTSGAAAAGAVPGVIGPYHLLQVIGEGGMGLVYLAEQREPLVRRVALKLIKPGMDTREVLARFEAERQALALMDHPNIARVLDAGLGPGDRPYFVMEYVAGIPITDYCDRHRLRNAERLQTFLQVCAALQHAHQKGIIHRDLKPSNILVTVQDGKPVPKVIDFGIAKATRQGSLERAAFTQLGMLIGTPEYISPEQAEASGLEVDTTTDIYSLGVVLYELLTGVLPFDSDTLRRAGYAEMHRIIREQDPPKPSLRVTALGATAADIARQHQTTTPALGKQLRGDLDAITMKAMEKDRTRRYASASEFAADITRYLNGEAVVASPPSVVYRTRKFVRRHLLGVTAATLVAASLTAGLAVSTWLYVQVRAARDASDHQSYLANIAAAAAHVRATEGNDARRRLLAAPVSLRNWEWRYLWAASIPVAATLPKGDLLAVSGRSIFVARESRLEEWDRVTFARLASHTLPGEALAADPKGRRVLVRSATGNHTSYTVIDVATGQPLSHPALGNQAWVRLTPDGAHFITQSSGNDAGITWWDAESGSAVAKRAATTAATVLGFTPDSRQVLLGTPWSISLWTPASGREAVVATLGKGVTANAAAVTPDGTRIITAGSDGLLKEWDVRTRAEIRTYGKQPQSYNMAISPDGRLVAVESWATISIWDCASGTKVVALKDGTDLGLHNPFFSPDGSQVFAHGRYGDIRVWDVRKARLSAGLRFPDTTNVVPSVDGRHIVARRTSGALERWDLDTLAKEQVASGSHAVVGDQAISDDGQRLAAGTADGALLVWSDPGSPPLVLGQGSGSVVSIAFSRDGVRIAAVWSGARTGDQVSGPARRLRAWDIPAGRQLIDVDVDPSTVAFDGSGRRVLVVGAMSQTLERRRHDGMARSIGPTCNTDTHDTLQVWDLESRQESMGARKQCAHAAAFTTDGASVVSDSWETPVVLHAVGSDAISMRSEEMPPILSLAVSPDGSRIAIATGESQIVVLDARTLEALLAIRVESQVTHQVVFSADGTRLLTVTAADEGRGPGIVHVYDTRPPHEAESLVAGGAVIPGAPR